MIEAQVLTYIIDHNDISLITLNNINHEYFNTYPEEFNFIKTFYDKYEKVPDKATFLAKFEEFPSLVVKETPKYLLEELINQKTIRSIAKMCNNVRGALMSDSPDVEQATSIIFKGMEELGKAKTLESTDLLRDTSRYDRYEDKINNFDNYFIKTGFPELDAEIGGWDVNEDLVTIVARNGVGKTWVLLKCSVGAVEQGKRVGIYSGEMSEDTVGYRLDTLMGHISNGAMMHGGASIRNEYKKYLNTLKDKEGCLKVITPKSIGGFATVTTLKAFIEKENLDILFIDQHSLLEDEQGGKGDTEKAAHISKALKTLQSTKRIPIICVSQQNREKVDGKPFDTTQVAVSDRIAQDSSNVFFLERNGDIMRIHCVKIRNAGSGKILSYAIDLNMGIFQFIPEKEDISKPIMDSNGNEYSEDEVTF